ncbi:DNA-binding transcriptional regulator, AcrR family [Parafrankia irregularis]|uniref:DNA-binding transcriptional regulator, AcrR family n=1 Tax=Parafrankia irregularis TaxID=795642 RepID=A0A0S4R190_9ACTN|nr:MULTISPECIES: TetR/AcrR family transcriptional regulator [Parafrankia]MBE3203618.1 TetR/AcrR family transcriptional regulator [Parafrankia sp. CH37]CUU60554.1 DNA-binding transcriptional regulator, AcrR family [Parafrankia irregularis]
MAERKVAITRATDGDAGGDDVHGRAGPAFEDLTARARIRDAALRLFAEQGFEATTIRGVAEAAGVSSGLVRHHFGAKEALREACDTYALERAMAIKEEAVVAGRLADPTFMVAVHPTLLLLQRYVARSMVDGSAAAAGLFDAMVAETERWIATGRLAGPGPDDDDDPRAFAAALVAMQTGLLILHDHVSRALGTDMLDVDGQVRLGRAVVDIHSRSLLSAEQAAQARAAYDEIQARRPARARGEEPEPARGEEPVGAPDEQPLCARDGEPSRAQDGERRQ